MIIRNYNLRCYLPQTILLRFFLSLTEVGAPCKEATLYSRLSTRNHNNATCWKPSIAYISNAMRGEHFTII